MQEGGMDHQRIEATAKLATFGRRKVTPRVCIADSKQHVRTFLAEVLEELGFIACECNGANRLASMLDAQLPDLVVLGLSAGTAEVGNLIETLATKKFDGGMAVASRASQFSVR
jgi:CheY-like chemotaxis protein